METPASSATSLMVGTLDFQGDVFEYLQDDALNAAGFAANATGKPKAPPLKQNECGMTLGRPVWIRHIYNGRNAILNGKTYDPFPAEYCSSAHRPPT